MVIRLQLATVSMWEMLQWVSAKTPSSSVFVNGGYVTVNAVPDASARLPGMCYFRCKKIQIHWRTSALFLPTLTHPCLTIVSSDILAYWALLADWWNLYFEVVCLELSDFLSGTVQWEDSWFTYKNLGQSRDRACLEYKKTSDAIHAWFQLSIYLSAEM